MSRVRTLCIAIVIKLWSQSSLVQYGVFKCQLLFKQHYKYADFWVILPASPCLSQFLCPVFPVWAPLSVSVSLSPPAATRRSGSVIFCGPALSSQSALASQPLSPHYLHSYDDTIQWRDIRVIWYNNFIICFDEYEFVSFWVWEFLLTPYTFERYASF